MENRPAAGRGRVTSQSAQRNGRHLRLTGRTDPGREALESFVRRGFRETHGATVRSFMPMLIGLYDATGSVVGVAGYRSAELEPLYLEQYLSEPIERAIARQRPGLLVFRAEVAEIGNFVCRDGEAAQAMVAVLAGLLRDHRHRWVAFTATRAVRGIMRRLGIRLAELGPADPCRIVATADDWGAYYNADPRVMLGYVPEYRGARGQNGSNGKFPPSSRR
jgi:hypothetical protein